MKSYYLFEIEADGKPIYSVGEWENVKNLTKNPKEALDPHSVAYGEIENGKYIELYTLK